MSAVINNTGEYLKLHADIESEGSRSPVVTAEALENAIDTVIGAAELGSDNTVEGIARLCAWLSTPEREVYARIECVNGKPVAYLVRGDDQHFLPAFLRRQAG